MIGFQLFMLVAILFLSGKDATNFRLKEKHKVNKDLEKKRIDRNHRDGVVLNILYILPFVYFDPTNWWRYLLYTALLRLAIYDIAFNYWGGLDHKHLGSTSWWDQQFIKVVGKEGAVDKSVVFLGLLILTNVLL